MCRYPEGHRAFLLHTARVQGIHTQLRCGAVIHTATVAFYRVLGTLIQP